jgi:hypothetical protein
MNFLKMRIKGQKNSTVRLALLKKKLDLNEFINLKASEFTEEYFAQKLGLESNTSNT